MSVYRRIRYRAGRSILKFPRRWLYHRGLGVNDVYLAAFPRSGSTWLRFMLSEILTGHPAEFDNINEVIPEVRIHRMGAPILPSGGRLIKTHEAYRSDYKKAIYLLRDVRDVVLSLYKRETELHMLDGLYSNFDDYLRAFLRGKTTHFGTWHHHVQSWLQSPLANTDNLLVIQFEDMRRNTEKTLAQIVEFIGSSADANVIQDAIRNNSLERMRAKEKRARTTPTSTQVNWIGRDGRFVGKGSVGGWREKLTPAQVQLIEDYAGEELARLRYSTGTLAPMLEEVRS